MIISSVRVQNYRSIYDQQLQCDELTALVGPNGAGKSAFLQAMELFYAPSPSVSEDDFYARDTEKPLRITLTFGGLSSDEKKRFQKYVTGEELQVSRVISSGGGKDAAKYHGFCLGNRDFQLIRQAGGAAEQKKKYNEFRQREDYSDLPSATSAAKAIEALGEWEADHPDRCERIQDDGQFFGFSEVALGYLGNATKFILVPAVKEAVEEAQEGKRSAITQIMDLMVRNVLAESPEIKDLKADIDKRYREIVDPAKIEDMKQLEGDLTATLRQYVPDSSVGLFWQGLDEISVPLPKADVHLDEDGFRSRVERTGHGLQRAFIFTMLQHLALVEKASRSEGSQEQTGASEDSRTTRRDMPDFVLAIEEPELYQHPNRQRHLARVLHDLAHGQIAGVGSKTQVIYATHSPFFVDIDRFEHVRLCKKIERSPGQPKTTSVIQTSLDDVANDIWKACDKPGEPFTGDTLRPRLSAVMTPWVNEGFFADLAVLVEGEDDRAAVLGAANAVDEDLESQGIAVIPCGGKTCLDRPAAIFARLGIPVYLIWDSDEGTSSKPEENHRLLRLMKHEAEDWPSFVSDKCACFKQNLEKTVEQELGQEVFGKLLEEEQEKLDIGKKQDAIKNPTVLANVLRRASESGETSSTLQQIVAKILDLRHRETRAKG